MIYENLYINYKIEQDNTKLGFICDAANKKQRETVDAWSKGNYWNKIENRVDFSAWSRLNDFIWEPARVPVHKDKDEFNNWKSC